MLSHLALRLACMEALCPTGTPPSGPWPTVAKDRVFDTRLDTIDGLVADDCRPMVVMYAEDVEAAPGSSTNGLPHQPTLTVVFELANAFRASPQGATELEIGYPASDPVLEASLDVLASQVYRRIVLEPPPALVKARRRVSKFTSAPFRDPEGGRKLAVRALSLSIDLPTYSDALSELQLAQVVADLLPAGSQGRTILDQAIASVRDGTAAVTPPAPVSTSDPAKPQGADLTIRPAERHPGTPDIVAAWPNTPPG